MKNGIFFEGNSSNSKLVFSLQKTTARFMIGDNTRNSHRRVFTGLEILPLPCEYVSSLMNSVMGNQEHFLTDSAVTVLIQ